MIQNAQWSRICVFCPKLELWLALCMSFFHIVCPFSYFHLFFILCRTFYIKLDVFLFNIIFIFCMNDAFFSFIQQFIQLFVAKYSFKKIFICFWEALFKFKISFIQNYAVLFIKKKYSFFFKVVYRTGLGRGGCNKSSQNPGIAKIGSTPPPQSWH